MQYTDLHSRSTLSSLQDKTWEAVFRGWDIIAPHSALAVRHQSAFRWSCIQTHTPPSNISIEVASPWSIREDETMTAHGDKNVCNNISND